MTEEEVPLEPGDMVYALYPGNGKYYKAMASELAIPRICKVAFQDGTFSRDTPPECILVSLLCSFCFPSFYLALYSHYVANAMTSL